VLPDAIKHDVGTLIMFAVRRTLSDPDALREVVDGLVTRDEVDADRLDPADPLGLLRDGAGSVIEAAYRFCRHEPWAHVILTGTGEASHLEANLAAIQAPPLPPAIQERLRKLFGAVDSVSGN
jgi:aryl-alcohol dehydrogenase-like predicted oxidoreductase